MEAAGARTATRMAIPRSKRYRGRREGDRKKTYSLDEASASSRPPPTKFDQTVTLSFRLGVDPASPTDVRAPAAAARLRENVRVLVFAQGVPPRAARRASSSASTMIKKCQEASRFRRRHRHPGALAFLRHADLRLGIMRGPRASCRTAKRRQGSPGGMATSNRSFLHFLSCPKRNSARPRGGGRARLARRRDADVSRSRAQRAVPRTHLSDWRDAETGRQSDVLVDLSREPLRAPLVQE